MQVFNEAFQLESSTEERPRWSWRTVKKEDGAEPVVEHTATTEYPTKEAAERAMTRAAAGRRGGASGFRPMGK